METAFSNFEKAFKRLDEVVKIYEESGLNTIEKEGLIKRLEYTFELSWKTLKGYLEASGEIVKSPRDTLKKAFQYELINNGTLWLEMLENRNLLAHTYREDLLINAFDKLINSYYEENKRVFIELKRLSHEE